MASKAVNRPTNEKQKELDINNKLQLYGIYSAFAIGKVPSNKQIDVALNSFLASSALSKPSPKLSADGQKLVADVRDVVEKAKLLILTKNEGNVLQDFIWQTQQISGGDASLPNAPIGKDVAKQHGNEALEGLRTLGTLIISNGQFRKLLSDATVLLRSIAGDAATKTASKVQPPEHVLNQIYEPAEDNTWHEVPDLSRDKLKSQFNVKKPFGKKEIQNAAGDASQAAHPSGARDPADTAALAAQDQQQGTASGIDARAGATAGLSILQDHVSAGIPDERKDQAKNYKARTQDYLKTKLPQERREQTVWRLKKMIVEIQGHQDYQRAIETLLRLAEEYGGHSKNLAGQSTGAVKGAHSDNSLQAAEADLKTLIERFANSTSADDLIDSINQIYRDADADPELKNWFKRVDSYIRRALQEQGYILQDASTDEWNALYDQGNFLLREKYRGHTDRIVDEFKYIGKQFDEDPQNKAFGAAVNKLFLDLGNDENGKATFKPHLLKDLTEVILPAVFENIRYVPIPRIEVSDPTTDAIVENLVIESDNLAPNVFEFGSDNYWRWGRKKISNKNKNKIKIAVSGVQLDLRDVAYYVKKKQGFPSIKDTGVADIFLGGSGLSFTIEAENADKSDHQHFIKINKVHVDVKNVNIKLKKSSHKILFALAKPIILRALRPVLQKVLEKQIKDNVHQLDAIIYEIKTEVDKAAAEFQKNPDPENAQNIYQRYATAANSRLLQGKQKKEQLQQRTKDTKVNAAVTQHNSIFPNIKLPGGISTKATEYKDLASKGEKWESPVFSIGSSKETSSLPKVSPVTRKPHAASAGTGTGLGSTGAGSFGNTGVGAGTAGFSSQVDQAFGKAPTNGTNGLNGSALPTNGNTTLYTQSPVLTGAV
jgi:uncharacterized membrane-anchored protein YhcB (DUF1043 family)